jgi:hypothetical protein
MMLRTMRFTGCQILTLAVEPQLGVWQSGLHVARIVTQPFEIAFGFGDVYDDRVVGKAFDGRLEFGIQADT